MKSPKELRAALVCALRPAAGPGPGGAAARGAGLRPAGQAGADRRPRRPRPRADSARTRRRTRPPRPARPPVARAARAAGPGPVRSTRAAGAGRRARPVGAPAGRLPARPPARGPAAAPSRPLPAEPGLALGTGREREVAGRWRGARGSRGAFQPEAWRRAAEAAQAAAGPAAATWARARRARPQAARPRAWRPGRPGGGLSATYWGRRAPGARGPEPDRGDAPN